MTKEVSQRLCMSDLAVFLGKSPDTIYRWVLDGKLSQPETVGNKKLFDVTRVLKEVKQNGLKVTLGPTPTPNIAKRDGIRRMTATDLAVFLGVTLGTVRNWTKRGYLAEPEQVGNKKLYTLSTVRGNVERYLLDVALQTPDGEWPTGI